MMHRLTFTEGLHARARAAAGVTRTYATLDLLYSVWLLIEQTRKAYEVAAAHVDVRFVGQRRSLDSRINDPRPTARQEMYYQTVWLFGMLEDVPDSAFARLGLEPVVARHVLKGIMDRSAARMMSDEATLRSFAEKYDCVCSAYKHGRVAFAMRPILDLTDGLTGNLRIEAATDMVTVLRSARPASVPDAFVMFAPDDEFWCDIDRVLSLLLEQVPKFHAIVDRVTVCLEETLRQIEAGTNHPLPTIPFFIFVEPASPSEASVLEALNGGKLLLYTPSKKSD